MSKLSERMKALAQAVGAIEKHIKPHGIRMNTAPEIPMVLAMSSAMSQPRVCVAASG